MSTFIGIDIGSRYTKVVELEHKPQAKGLLNCFLFATPYSAQALPGPRQIAPKRFWDEITSRVPSERIKSARIGVSLPANSVMATTLLVPRVAKNELPVVAQNEARRKMIPASTPEHIFESSLVGVRIVAKIPRFEVLVMRSEKQYVRQVLELFKHIGTSPSSIALAPCALFTLAPDEILKKQDVDTAFVDIGLQSVNTSITREGKLAFFRNASYGLQDIIQDLSLRLGRTEPEAEEIIKEKGIVEVDFDLKDKVAVAEEIMRQKYEASLKSPDVSQKEEINLVELRLLWQAHIDRIIHELRRSLSYYKEQSEGRRVEYIYFLGGGCQIKNLVSLLMKQVGGQGEAMFPFKGLNPPQGSPAQDANSTPIFSNACALALGLSFKDKGANIINFLPWELKKKEALAARRLIILSVKFILIFLFSAISLAAFINNRSVRAAIKKVDSNLAEVKSIADALKNLNQRDKKVKLESALIQSLIDGRVNFDAPLAQLAKAVPQEVLLTSVVIAKTGPSAYAEAPEAAGIPEDTEAGTQGPEAFGGQAPQEAYAAANTLSVEIKAEIFADYETALAVIARMLADLEKPPAQFKNVRASPLELEKISPAAGKALPLTLPIKRNFTVTAEIAR